MGRFEEMVQRSRESLADQAARESARAASLNTEAEQRRRVREQEDTDHQQAMLVAPLVVSALVRKSIPSDERLILPEHAQINQNHSRVFTWGIFDGIYNRRVDRFFDRRAIRGWNTGVIEDIETSRGDWTFGSLLLAEDLELYRARGVRRLEDETILRHTDRVPLTLGTLANLVALHDLDVPST